MEHTSFLLLYKSMVRPHLQYANSVWCSYQKRDITEIEKVQKRATKLIISLKNTVGLKTADHHRQPQDAPQTFCTLLQPSLKS